MSSYIQSEEHAEGYLLFRPSPPPDMITAILHYLRTEVSEPCGVCVDVGCGSGQGTSLLSPHFQKVLGFDPDPRQIKQAVNSLNHLTNITFSLGGAEELDCADRSVSLVCAVQSVHWFNLDKFYSEVERVLLPGGVLAVSGYKLPNVLSASMPPVQLSHIVLKLFEETLGRYMPEGSRTVYLDNYTSQRFMKVPFSNEAVSRYEFETEWREGKVSGLVGYLRTTSTYQKYLEANGQQSTDQIIQQFVSQLAEELGQGSAANSQEMKIKISFTYFLLLSRKPTA